MRAIFWLLLLAVVAVVTAMAAKYNVGYVLLVLPPWRAELSHNFFILLIVALFAVMYGFLRVLRHTINLPRSVAAFRQERTRNKATDEVQQTNRLLTEGRYGHALRSAERAWPQLVESKLQAGVLALAAWRAAHALHNPEQVAIWHERVKQAGDDLDPARLMTEATLALDERRFDDALAALQSLSGRGGKHIAALRLQLKAEQGLGNWTEVARLVRQLEKAKALTADQALPLRQRALRETLRGLYEDLPKLQRYWRDLDASDRSSPPIALEAARAFAAADDCREAQRIIEDALEDNWDSTLALAYAECHGGDVLGRIARAEKWLSQHPRDDALLLGLGRLCREQQLWGKARSFFEASLAILPTHAAHVELAALLEELQESVLAGRHYRAAALLK